MSQLIIGDIHGCYYELMQLIDKSALGDHDEIIAIGDLFDRGPEAPQVFEFFRDTPNARAIMGNHEWKHIRATSGELPPRFAQLLTRFMLDNRYGDFLDFINVLPFYLDLPDALIVHGFFEPGIPINQQKNTILAGVMSAEKYLQDTYEQPWYTYYDGDKPIVVGHRDYTDEQAIFCYKDRVYGIDTRCVYGGALTGLRLPEFELISVPARRDHWSKIQRKHGFE